MIESLGFIIWILTALSLLIERKEQDSRFRISKLLGLIAACISLYLIIYK